MRAESVDINGLHFDPSNARLHSNKNLDAIKGSLTKFGQQTPIVIDEKGVVLKGNGTLAAAKALGWGQIWAIRATMNAVQKAAYAIADNRSSELASWDKDVLAKTILSLRDEEFALEEIGFDELDIGKILGEMPGVFKGDSGKELNSEEFQNFAHRCPKCGFEYDQPEEQQNDD